MRLLLTLFAGGGLFQQTAAPPARPGINYDESSVRPYTLPNALVSAGDSPVRDAAEWRAKRRPELRAIFSREVYGRTRGGRPAGMHWAGASIDRRALGGKAVRTEITVGVPDKQDGPKMHLRIYQPPGAPGAQWPSPA